MLSTHGSICPLISTQISQIVDKTITCMQHVCKMMRHSEIIGPSNQAQASDQFLATTKLAINVAIRLKTKNSK